MSQCPRCHGRLIVRHGEMWCWTHGTIATERHASDPVWEPAPLRDRVSAPRTGAKWTDEEWAYVLAHFDDLSAAEIAARIGRRPAGIYKRLSKLGVSKPHPTPKRRPDVPATIHARAIRAGERRRWTQEDDEWLLDNIGRGLLRFVSSRLGRTPEAVRWRLRILGERRASDGMLTMSEVARAYNCPLHRVRSMVRDGTLPTQRIPGVWFYRIDPADCERIRSLLTAPKQTYRYCPPDTGDWYKRYE